MSTIEVPSTMRALIVQEDKTVAVISVATPTLADNEILVKASALAINPTDWKHLLFLTAPGTIIGSDFAGTIVKVSDKLSTNLAVGDKVAGCLRGGVRIDRGAFAEYVKTFADLVWKVPEGTMSFEEASTTGIGLYTAVQVLYEPGRLGLIEPYETQPVENSWVFVYGGSTSVGQYTIQLAHLSGYKVATVASPHNHTLATELGADVVFDYNDPDAISKLKETTNDSIHVALDTISEKDSQIFTVKVLATGSPGKIITLLPTVSEATALRPDVTIQRTLIYTAFGLTDVIFGNIMLSPETDRTHMSVFLQKKLPKLVAEGKIRANVIKLWLGGLDKVHEGLQYMRDGKISAEKLVYRI